MALPCHPPLSRLYPIRKAIASEADVPAAQERYEELVESGDIHPRARAAYVILSDGRSGPLSPPIAPTAVDTVKNYWIKREAT